MGPEMKLGGFTGIPSPGQTAESVMPDYGVPIPKPPNVFHDWQQRVVDEKNELDTKRLKLHQFIQSHHFNNLSKEDRRLLVDQYDTMGEYLRVLIKRIDRFRP